MDERITAIIRERAITIVDHNTNRGAVVDRDDVGVIHINIAKVSVDDHNIGVLYNCDVNVVHNRHIIGTVDRHRHGLGDHTAIAIIDRVGECVRCRLANAQMDKRITAIIRERAITIVDHNTNRGAVVNCDDVGVVHINIAKISVDDHHVGVLHNCDVDVVHNRHIIGAVDRHRHGLGDHTAIAIIDRVGERVRCRLASS
ncbi:hypothetical protein PsWM33_01986 [Pseudovibrio sp. WM33]|nr:hypothetical protein PsWM33_01986 [Pseudovibrio sp. WM33]